MKKLLTLVAASVGLMVVSAGSALAVFTIPVASAVEMGPVEAWLGIAVIAYLALLGYRKFVKTANRT